MKVQYENQTCHDCGKDLLNTDAVQYETEAGTFYKCKECHQKDPVLKNYQPCEVFSRVVGYMRPIQNWNVGKAQEYKDRKNFKVK